jgi:predicted DNA-binding transcriptional regulator AlpA
VLVPRSKSATLRSRTASLAEDKTRKSRDILPGSLPPRGLSRVEAAAYVGVSPSLFDALISDGRMPGPKRINSRVVWDRLKLDVAFEALDSTDADGTDDEWKVAV